ncbi:AbrB/MazE/SpoVT family DNA-binding domain-containing protein [Paenibacillus sp. y28]|uniref:AbrB/MazE/SpoVT family DNA-binding domain-containing protein n=1 Tax=Paenibacillus sp. y28 TaxID=3129110 RepID=UPI00301B4CA9
MELAKVTGNNHITIPKVIRDKLGVKVGDHVAFIEEFGQIVIVKATVTIERTKEGMEENGT